MLGTLIGRKAKTIFIEPQMRPELHAIIKAIVEHVESRGHDRVYVTCENKCLIHNYGSGAHKFEEKFDIYLSIGKNNFTFTAKTEDFNDADFIKNELGRLAKWLEGVA